MEFRGENQEEKWLEQSPSSGRGSEETALGSSALCSSQDQCLLAFHKFCELCNIFPPNSGLFEFASQIMLCAKKELYEVQKV